MNFYRKNNQIAPEIKRRSKTIKSYEYVAYPFGLYNDKLIDTLKEKKRKNWIYISR